MALPVFSPPQNPNVGYGYGSKPRVLTNQYGDGYKSRTGDGLNTIRRDLSLVWGPLTPANADAIESFLIARGGTEPFLYTTPLDAARGLPARRYVCPEWQRNAGTIAHETVSATFEEDFGLGG